MLPLRRCLAAGVLRRRPLSMSPVLIHNHFITWKRLGDVSQVLMYYTLNRLSTQSSPTRSSVIMILQVLHCPHCQGTDIVRHGQTQQGKQRYRCREQPCASRTFLLNYSYPGQSPEVKQQIVEMAMNASGIRDTARVLHVSTNTVMTELKKKESTLQHVNRP